MRLEDLDKAKEQAEGAVLYQCRNSDYLVLVHPTHLALGGAFHRMPFKKLGPGKARIRWGFLHAA